MNRSAPRAACAAAALAAILLLAGCVSGASGEPSPTPSGSAAAESPSASAAPDPVAEVVPLVATPRALELRDADDGVVSSLDYMSEPAAAIAALTELLDAPPADEAYEASNHFPAGVSHRWGDFVLDERFFDEAEREALGLDYIWPRFSVRFEGESVNGVALTTSTGARVGVEFASLAEPVDPELETCMGWAVESAEITGDERSRTIGVELTRWAYDPVTENYGDQVDHVVFVVAPVEVTSECV